MKKLALVIACVCYVCTCPLVYAQDSVAVSLNIDDFGKIRPSSLDVQFDIEGAAQLDYLKVQSTDRFAAVKLGYDENAVVKKILDLKSSGYHTMEMTLKDLNGSTNWNQVKISLNDEYPTRVVTIGNYLSGAEDLGDGWFKVSIPVSDLKPFGATSHMVFPHAYNVSIGVKEITFKGDSEPFQWFGALKYDNARKDNQIGQSELVFNPGGIIPNELRLKLLSQGTEQIQVSMPFASFKPGVLEGENTFLGVVIDKNGNKHYSDTVSVVVRSGISYQITPVSCYGVTDGSIDLSIDGDAPPYTYAWSNGSGAEDISGLGAGIYTVDVTDALGRTGSALIQLEQPNPLTANLTPDHCFDDRAFLNIAGGSAPYQFSVDGGAFEPVGDPEENEVWRVVTNRFPDEERYVNYAADMGNDKFGNLYIAGNYGDKLSFGEGSVGEQGSTGNYLVKLNPEGTFIWGFYTKTSQGSPYNWNNRVQDFTVDDNGNSTLIIDINAGQVLIDDQSLSKGSYLVHFNNVGELQWIKTFERMLYNTGTDALNNIYVIGRKNHSSNTGNGLSDLFLLKYGEEGSLLWQKDIYGKKEEANTDMYVTNAGEVYITGDFSGDINFDGFKFQSRGLKDMYLAKYDSNGDVLWAKSGGSVNGHDNGWSLTTDDNDNLFIMAGFGAANGVFGDFQISNAVQILLRIDASGGNVIWGRPYMTSGFPRFEEGFDIVVKNQSEIYITVQGFELILREGEDFSTGYDENFLMEFDYSGALLSMKKISEFYYDSWIRYPLVVTSDNHLLFTDYIYEYTIVKQGEPMKQLVIITPDNEQIDVKDANNCIFTLNDLTIENPAPAPPVICYITSGTGGNALFFNAGGQDEPVVSYNIYRETFATGEYEMIGSTRENVFEFSDTTSNTMERSYQYVVTALDGCANESGFSEPHRTMHLTVNEGNLGQINLIWDGYHGFDYNSFKIYRGSSPADMELLTSVPSYLYTYTDLDPSPFAPYYQIRIENDRSCPEGQSSNTQGRLAEGGASREITSNVAANFGVAGNLTFYPNPARDRIQVRFSPDGDEYQLKVIDAAGRVVRQINGVFDQAVIEKEDLPAGIYNVVLSKNSGKPLHGRIAFE